jgi:hypothetical protein
MLRIASLTLVGGAVLLMTWVLAPAATRPQRAEAPRAPAGALTPASSALVDFEHELDRMRARLASRPAYPQPVRDPFRFGRRPVEPRHETAPVAVPPPAPALPRLVAILSDTVDGVLVRRAALAFDRSVRIAGVGDMVGALRIRSRRPGLAAAAKPACTASMSSWRSAPARFSERRWAKPSAGRRPWDTRHSGDFPYRGSAASFPRDRRPPTAPWRSAWSRCR